MPRDVHDIKRQILVDKRFKNVIENLAKIKMPASPSFDAFQVQDYIPEGKVTRLEFSDKHFLDAKNGMMMSNRDDLIICAYDESIASYDALEGRAVCTAHALVYLCSDDYIPTTYVTLRFFTRSSLVIDEMGESAIKAENVPRESAISIAKDKIEFLNENCIKGSILLIDGPLIAGDAYTSTMKGIKTLNERGVLTTFFVKNSTSNMVVDNIEGISGKYHSDMHWSNSILHCGQRSDFFEYVDRRNPENAKVFCYIKFYENTSPVRLEFPRITYLKFKDEIGNIVDLSYFYLLVQGNKNNPQLRPIAVAEKFARETLKLIDVNQEIKKVRLVPTMNENRWGS